jgi:hypothetical protein
MPAKIASGSQGTNIFHYRLSHIFVDNLPYDLTG